MSDVLSRLSSLERQTWGEIFQSTAGRKSNTRNHFIPVSAIVKDARERLIENNLDEYDELCSLSISGKERVWGVLSDGVFFIIWYDLNHEICPSEKKNT
ncbi:MAG: hypothetical protein LBT12_07540 [Oscillospiraceae bacterium]|nr:hypothetical protein [Oscillospiraceae bacterium]